MNTTSNWQESFADKFVTRGQFGERRLTRIFVNKLTPSDPVSLDEQVLGELEAFIQEEKDKSYKEALITTSSKIRLRYQLSDKNSRGTALKDTYRKGFNDGLDVAISLLTPNNKDQ